MVCVELNKKVFKRWSSGDGGNSSTDIEILSFWCVF